MIRNLSLFLNYFYFTYIVTILTKFGGWNRRGGWVDFFLIYERKYEVGQIGGANLQFTTYIARREGNLFKNIFFTLISDVLGICLCLKGQGAVTDNNSQKLTVSDRLQYYYQFCYKFDLYYLPNSINAYEWSLRTTSKRDLQLLCQKVLQITSVLKTNTGVVAFKTKRKWK